MINEMPERFVVDRDQLQELIKLNAITSFKLWCGKIWSFRMLSLVFTFVVFFDLLLLEPSTRLIFGSSLRMFMAIVCEILFQLLRAYKPFKYFLEQSEKSTEDALFTSKVRQEISQMLGE